MNEQQEIMDLLDKHQYLVYANTTPGDTKCIIKYPERVDAPHQCAFTCQYEIKYPNTLVHTVWTANSKAFHTHHLPTYLIRPYIQVDIRVTCMKHSYNFQLSYASVNNQHVDLGSFFDSLKHNMPMLDILRTEHQVVDLFNKNMQAGWPRLDLIPGYGQCAIDGYNALRSIFIPGEDK